MTESTSDVTGSGQAAATAASVTAPAARLNYAYLGIIGVAMGVVSLFTVLAWIPAILTGLVIGRAGVEQRKGVKSGAATQLLRLLAVTGGVLAMLFLGAIVGGLIAFMVAALAAFAERVIADTSAMDQTIGRILVVLIAVIVWFVALQVLRMNVNVSFGS